MAGSIGGFSFDGGGINQMLDRRQNNAQFLRTLLASEMEQARQASRQSAALQLQRELGMGSLGLDRDRFGFEQELGRGAQGLNRDRFALESELGRGAQGLAGQRFGFEQEMGRGQMGLARDAQGLASQRFGLEQELGRGGLENAMGRLSLDEGVARAQAQQANAMLLENSRQFDERVNREMEMAELNKAMQEQLVRMKGVQDRVTLAEQLGGTKELTQQQIDARRGDQEQAGAIQSEAQFKNLQAAVFSEALKLLAGDVDKARIATGVLMKLLTGADTGQPAATPAPAPAPAAPLASTPPVAQGQRPGGGFRDAFTARPMFGMMGG